MKQDWIVLLIFCLVVLFALAVITQPRIDFNLTGYESKEIIKSVEEQTIFAPISNLIIYSVSFGPQERIYPGQGFQIKIKLNKTSEVKNINVELTNCPLAGNLNASTTTSEVIFDVYATESGLHSCYALASYEETIVKKQFSLPIYSEESKISYLWIILGLIVLFILIHLLGYDFKH